MDNLEITLHQPKKKAKLRKKMNSDMCKFVNSGYSELLKFN